MHADEGVLQIKHLVLREVAELAFLDKLEEGRDDIPMALIPGPHARFRCCIYKEREVIRYRVRLAEGKKVDRFASDNIIQVIEAACSDCPISSYVVTDNCQNCLGKSCISSCKFGAIEAGRLRTHIDPQKCKECGLCAKACPYNSIAYLQRPCQSACPVDALSYDENGISIIDNDKCIRCGQCIHKCPFGAISARSSMVSVIQALKSDKPVYLLLAPSTEGQFGQNITLDSWRKSAKALGFKDIVDVGFGGDLTAAYESDEWAEALSEGKKLTTSCCPAFVNMINKFYPELKENVSTTVSPMCAVSRMIKAKEPDAVTVFLGPCIAKKSEALEAGIEGNADYAIIYSEFRAMLQAKGVDIDYSSQENPQEASKYGKRFGNSGGVTAAVLKSLEEAGIKETPKVAIANGAKECNIKLKLLSMGKLPEDFIEGMCCEGGCVGGPSAIDSKTLKTDRDDMISKADERGVRESIASIDTNAFSMHRS